MGYVRIGFLPWPQHFGKCPVKNIGCMYRMAGTLSHFEDDGVSIRIQNGLSQFLFNYGEEESIQHIRKEVNGNIIDMYMFSPSDIRLAIDNKNRLNVTNLKYHFSYISHFSPENAVLLSNLLHKMYMDYITSKAPTAVPPAAGGRRTTSCRKPSSRASRRHRPSSRRN